MEKHLSHGESLSFCCHLIFVRQLFSVLKKAVLQRRKLSNNLSAWIVYCCGSAKQLKQTTKTNYLRVISISCCLKSKNLLFSKLHVKRWLKTLYFSGTVWFWKTTFQVSAIMFPTWKIESNWKVMENLYILASFSVGQTPVN